MKYKNDLKQRTKTFSILILEMVETLPLSIENRIIISQLIRSSTSVAANYRATLRSKSHRDFINKLKIVEEEADETLFWLEVLEERKKGNPQLIKSLLSEGNELLSIFVASILKAKKNN